MDEPLPAAHGTHRAGGDQQLMIARAPDHRADAVRVTSSSSPGPAALLSTARRSGALARQVRALAAEASRPPVGDRRFWIVQGLVVLVAALHATADLGFAVPPLGIPHFATVTLFLVPIVYAALNFGLGGAVFTAVWVTVLSLPDLLLWDGAQDRADDSLQLLVVNAIAVFVGQRVERERLARQRAEEAERRMQTYARRVVQAHEEERRRIAHELHDDPLQAMLHLARRLHSLTELGELPGAAQGEVEQVQAIADDAAVTLREIARGLRPPTLDDLGLVAGVRQLVSAAQRQNRTAVELQVTGEPRRLGPDCELGLYRIVQEALNNVERHAGAQRVEVRLRFRRQGVHLAIQDDGLGFQVLDANRSLGLPGMRERASLLGGELSIESAPGRGTLIRVDVPTPA